MSSAQPLVSGVVTCFNEQRQIRACLESLAWCDEIVVLDSFSSDDTAKIAKSFPKVRFLERTYYGAAAGAIRALRKGTIGVRALQEIHAAK